MSRPPRLLTVAGSDSGGGAGIQADLKTFAAHGGFGMSAITAVTAQNTVAVTAVQALPPAMVAAQIDAVFEDLGVDAVKIGMLADAGIVAAVAAALARHGAGRSSSRGGQGSGGAPVVLDPVMVAKSGDPLLADAAVAAVVEKLLPIATVVTPNLPEARRLLGRPLDEADSEERRREMARALAVLGSTGDGDPGPAVLVKGGHGAGDEVVDLLYEPAVGEGRDGTFHRWANPRIAGRATHGTGCTLSSAIAARLARGEALPAAVEGAIGYLRRAMESAAPLGAGHGPVNHFPGTRNSE
ncbi:MAG TPA: bifunctional hydroxymethylpyrimidine kinase/phosphomethylpyrimidine kinase [Thermoanaerobaculia bacterium]|nr:bifunctional hydroxymethylpyrimidine kinase/phosphomethylpyrimidine kinase [Thermoanaerobaculia bacterium]